MWNLKTIDNKELTIDNCFKKIKHNTSQIYDLIKYKNQVIACFTDYTIKIWDLSDDDTHAKLLYTYNICASKLLLYNGYLYCIEGKIIIIFKYLPYYEDYHKALYSVYKIMNSKCISYKKSLYKGKLYLREIKLMMNMYDTYHNFISN